jgi:hypothetical protein
MKHLVRSTLYGRKVRRFSAMYSLLEQSNESVNKEELQDFCDTYLAYLLDEGYSIVVSEIGFDEYVLVLRNGRRLDNVPIDSPELLFPWEEVKDHFIPFLHMLSKQYKITRSIKFWDLNKKFDRGLEKPFIEYDYSLSMVLEDRVSLEEVVQINIYLK